MDEHVHIYDCQPVIWKWTHGAGHLIVECAVCHTQNLMIQESPAYSSVYPNDNPSFRDPDQSTEGHLDSAKLINELMEAGTTAGKLMSRSSVENGVNDTLTELFDSAAQSITVILLELQHGLKLLSKEDVNDG